MIIKRKSSNKLLFTVFAGILFYVGLQNIPGILKWFGWIMGLIFPFILGSAIAFIMNVPMKGIEKLLGKIKRLHSDKIKRVLSFFITLLAVFFVVMLVVLVVVPELVNTTNSLIKQLPVAYDSLMAYLDKLNDRWPQVMSLVNDSNLDLQAVTAKVVTWLQNSAVDFLGSTVGFVGGVVSAITTFFIAFTFAIYVLFKKETLSAQAKKILYATLSTKAADRIIYIGRLSNTTFSNFLSGQCVEAVILGSMFFVTMSILRMPYALMMWILISLTALIPIFGAFIGLFVGTFLILIANPVQAIAFIIMFFVIQQIEGNLIYPHVVGGSVGLPSIWVLVAVTLGGKLMGIAGMLIFIPLCSVCYTLLGDLVNRRLEERKISPEKWGEKILLRTSDACTEINDLGVESREASIDSNEYVGNDSYEKEIEKDKEKDKESDKEI